VSLEHGDLVDKLVQRRRGGYCFEQNLLLRRALVELGMDVELHLARVRVGADPGLVRPRTHLVLAVTNGDERWLADVGLGSATLLAPLEWRLGASVERCGWSHRLVEDGSDLAVQTLSPDGWRDVYAFSPEPVPQIDVELSNWWTSTHPRSLFVTGLLISKQDIDGTRTVLSDWGDLALTVSTPAGTEVTALERDQVPAILAERFKLALGER
jgi:N-hydroxyarylamine O-acetyltransferase